MIPLAAFVLLAVQGEAKILQRPPRYNDPPSQYEQLVAQYQRGEYDSAVARVARTPAEAFEKPLENALARLWYTELTEKRAKMRNVTPKAWHDAVDRLLRFLLAVRMLHTEAALRTPLGQMNAQLRLARTADTTLERAQRDLEPHPGGSSYLTAEELAHSRHDWIVLIAVGYHLRSVLDTLPQHLSEAFQRYPEDPPLELCLGLYDERMARYSVVDESLVREVYPSAQVAGWRQELEGALTAYDRAARAPDHAAEAHLRMGRLRLQLNDLRRARQELEPLAASSEPPLIRYLALLLLGEVEELDKKPDAAAARYRDAVSLFPTSQAPFIALSRLSDSRGDVSSAREWLERAFAIAPDKRVDPWTVYYAPFMDIRPLVIALREQTRQ